MNTNRRFRKAAAQGFTLIELLIVVVVLGVLITIFASNLTGSTSGARATALTKVATSSAQSLNLLAQTCGVSSAVSSNPLATTGKTMADVLFEGATNVAAAYTSCYDRSGVRAMTNAVAQNGTAYEVEGFPVTLSGGGTAPISVVYANVPDEITLAMAQRYDAALTTLATSDVASPVVHYSVAATDLTRTVTVLVQ